MKKLWGRIRSNNYIRSVAVLGTGTILAQIITIAASPVLTRLFIPADFGLAALFAAVVGSITPAVNGKFEVAIVVAKSIRQSKQLLGISILVAFGFSILTSIGLWLCGDKLIKLIDAEHLGGWILLVPIALFFSGVLTALNYYSNRLHEYRLISRSKIVTALFSVGFSLAFGFFGFHDGMLVSSVMATAAVSVWLLHHYRSILNKSLLLWNPRKRVLVRRYRDFPIYNASTGILNGLTLALPVFFLSRYFDQSAVGYYALMIRVAMGPISFVAGAVSQVNLKRVGDLVNKRQEIRPYLLKATLFLAAIVAPLIFVFMPFAPPLFAWVFGEEWRISGTYLQILMPSLALKFVVSTLSPTLGATGNNRLGAVWKVGAFFLTFVIFMMAAPKVDLAGMFFTILITDIVLYSLYYLLIWYAAGHPKAYT